MCCKPGSGILKCWPSWSLQPSNYSTIHQPRNQAYYYPTIHFSNPKTVRLSAHTNINIQPFNYTNFQHPTFQIQPSNQTTFYQSIIQPSSNQPSNPSTIRIFNHPSIQLSNHPGIQHKPYNHPIIESLDSLTIQSIHIYLPAIQSSN